MLSNSNFCSSLLSFASSLSCSSCDGLVRRPYLLSMCNHLLCEDCLFVSGGGGGGDYDDDDDCESTQMSNTPPTNCPVCKEKISEKELVMNETLVTIVACVKKLNNIPLEILRRIKKPSSVFHAKTCSSQQNSQKIDINSLKIRSSSPVQHLANAAKYSSNNNTSADIFINNLPAAEVQRKQEDEDIDIDEETQINETKIPLQPVTKKPPLHSKVKTEKRSKKHTQSTKLSEQAIITATTAEQPQENIPKKIKLTTITICTTGLDGDCKDIIQSCSKHINGAKCIIRNEYQSRRVTHLICNVNEKTGRVRRTIKYMRALLEGVTIVSYEWFLASLTSSEWQDEQKFLVKGDEVYLEGEDWVKPDPFLFKGLLIFLRGSFKKPSPTKAEIVSLIVAGGGKEIRYDPSTTDQRSTPRNKGPPEVIIINDEQNDASNNNGKEKFKRREISYLFDCISAMKIL